MYKVVFAENADVIKRQEPGTIVIFPSDDHWNDFGFWIRVDILICSQRTWEEKIRFPGFLGFLDRAKRKPDVSLLKRLLSETGSKELAPNALPMFFMMLPNIGTYRKMVLKLGPVDARGVLLAIRDVVAAEGTASGNTWLRDVWVSPIFQNAFLRTSEAYFAWKNAGPILQGLEFEKVGRISEALKIRFQLAGRPNEHDLDFRFAVSEGVLPKRFAIVIGKNGVGKSQTLSRIADAALRGGTELTDGYGKRPSLNRMLAFAPTSATLSIFPSERRKRPKVWYRRFAIGNPSTGRRKQTASDLLVQLARTNEYIKDSSRLELFINAIMAIDNWEELALRTRHSPVVYFTELLRGSEQEKIARFASIELREEPVRVIKGKAYGLSSGELSFLRFAALASLYIENSTLLLLDEPETHLHPNFISQFVAVLNNLLEQTGSAAIIATHSVYFVREAFEDQVIVLRSDRERRVIPEVPTLKTFGADVGAISYFVFGEDQPSKLAREVERKISTTLSSWPEVLENYKDVLSLELLGEIRALIEDRDAGVGRS